MKADLILLLLGAIVWVLCCISVVRFIQVATKDDKDDEQ